MCNSSIQLNDFSHLKCNIVDSGGYPVFSIWVGLSDSANFHSKEDIQTCKSCHGYDLKDRIVKVSCVTCHNDF